VSSVGLQALGPGFRRDDDFFWCPATYALPTLADWAWLASLIQIAPTSNPFLKRSRTEAHAASFRDHIGHTADFTAIGRFLAATGQRERRPRRYQQESFGL
jgi:hypothetical protein